MSSKEADGGLLQVCDIICLDVTGMSPDEVAANDDDVSRAQVLSLQGSATTPIEELGDQLALLFDAVTYSLQWRW